MPPITALLHTCDDFLRLGRTLETLWACDEILVIDHGSADGSAVLARQYGANVRSAVAHTLPAAYLAMARYSWVLCLLPCESLTENLEASLLEWKLCPEENLAGVAACSFLVREETSDGWIDAGLAIRLVPRNWSDWQGMLPASRGPSRQLEGYLLRFRTP